ncbi:MAG TPA: hypothetical protein VFW38_13115 [Solirubrobacteraceae bacterium]|nr:hypothetical protein [Solirubrobacteraceae bacterium]
MAVLLTLVLLAVVIAVVGMPLFSSPHMRKDGSRTREDAPDRAELDSARDAKYREIRDAELDYRTGKLSQADFEAVDATLRAEALAILDSLRELEERAILDSLQEHSPQEQELEEPKLS